MEPKKCATIGCHAEASWQMIYRLGKDPETYCETGCTECTRGYMRRVIMHIISITPYPMPTCI